MGRIKIKKDITIKKGLKFKPYEGSTDSLGFKVFEVGELKKTKLIDVNSTRYAKIYDISGRKPVYITTIMEDRMIDSIKSGHWIIVKRHGSDKKKKKKKI